MITDKLLRDINSHASETPFRECCGVIVLKKGKSFYTPCRNISEKDTDFIMHPEDFANAEDTGSIQYIVHSHPYSSPEPSQADLIGIEKSGIPWLIVNYPTFKYTVTYPSGYKAPFEGRPFVHGVTDCLSIIQDYYLQELNIVINDYNRPDQWWVKDGYNFYDMYFEECGFLKVPLEQIKKHDVIVMRLGSIKNNHGAVYLGDNVMLHHITNRLSCKEIYGGYWMDITSYILRHKDLV